MEDPVILRKKNSRKLSSHSVGTKVLTSRDNWFKGRKWWVELTDQLMQWKTAITGGSRDLCRHWAVQPIQEQPRKRDKKVH